jgi:hypothetical protein
MPYAEQPTVAGWIEPSLPETSFALAAEAAEAGEAGEAGEPQDEMLAESAPEHTGLGNGFVWTAYAAVPISLLASFRLLMLPDELGTKLGLLPMLLFSPLLMLWLGRAVQVFDVRGLGVAMLMVLAMLLNGLRVLPAADTAWEILWGLVTVPLAIAWLRYFVMRFPDFK